MELKEYEITASFKMAAYGGLHKAIHSIVKCAISEAINKEKTRSNFITGTDLSIEVKEVVLR